MKFTRLIWGVAALGLAAMPATARRAPSRMGGTMRASFYNAPTRSSFASRNREWRGHTFALSYRGRTVHAVCRDYGPFVRGRDLDVSRDVAHRLGFINSGTARLHVSRLR